LQPAFELAIALWELVMWIAERGQGVEFSALVDPNATALIVIDVQNDFCHPEGAFGRVGHDNGRMHDLASALHTLLAEARRREVLTIFVRATYDRQVTSRVLAQHRRRLGLLDSLCLEGSWGAEWYSNVAPVEAPNELVLTKHRFDAFQGTPLDLYLRSSSIRSVIVTGVVTSGCVESTVRRAFFLDYNVVVPRDGVAEAVLDHHEVAMTVMQRSFATVTDVDAIIAAWRATNALANPSWRPEARRLRALQDLNTEALVALDVGSLVGTRAENARRVIAEARLAEVPLFSVRSVDVPLGRSPWADGELPRLGSPRFEKSSPTEMHVEKCRRSGFADTSLGLLLRTNDIHRLTLIGADAMSGSLAATALDALDADYLVWVVADACDDPGWPLIATAGARKSSAADVVARWQVGARRARQ
jgi:ureidoacrylate peracid hydrolase